MASKILRGTDACSSAMFSFFRVQGWSPAYGVLCYHQTFCLTVVLWHMQDLDPYLDEIIKATGRGWGVTADRSLVPTSPGSLVPASSRVTCARHTLEGAKQRYYQPLPPPPPHPIKPQPRRGCGRAGLLEEATLLSTPPTSAPRPAPTRTETQAPPGPCYWMRSWCWTTRNTVVINPPTPPTPQTPPPPGPPIKPQPCHVGASDR